MCGEVLDNFLKSILVARGVEVHATDPALFEYLLYLFGDPFRTIAVWLYVDAFTCGTYARHKTGKSAIMAFQKIDFLMIDERYIAVITLWGPAAGAANHHRRKPSAILEHNSLQFFSDSLTHLMHERAGKTAVADFLLSLLLHVDDFHFGEFGTFEPFVQRSESIFT